MLANDTAQTPVLIVGAGPTGLVLALWLTKAGVPVRIIDKHSGAGQASRAMVVHARILEFYQQLGIADRVIQAGIKAQTLAVRRHGKTLFSAELGEIGKGISLYPFALSYPQDDHERLLTEILQERGVTIEWNTELQTLKQDIEQVSIQLNTPQGTQLAQCAYVVGCDGASSTVRQQLGLAFAGGTYDQRFYVADVEIANPEVMANIDIMPCLEDATFVLAFPVRRAGMVRLIGIIPPNLVAEPDLSFEHIKAYAERVTELKITHTNWFSTYHVHHRVAEHFQQGRVFLAGDAGHIHSPAGGQGMNTGIGDAVNLGWKLSQVIQHGANPDLLATYELERLRFAKTLVKTTDQAFSFLVGRGPAAWSLRHILLPYIAPHAINTKPLRTLLFRTVSQTQIEYHPSPLSEGQTGRVQSGERLPWVESLDNYAPLTSRAWQVHVYGCVSSELETWALHNGIKLYRFAWSEAVAQTGLQECALYLIRPDGYIGLANAQQDIPTFNAYWQQWGFKPA